MSTNVIIKQWGFTDEELKEILMGTLIREGVLLPEPSEISIILYNEIDDDEGNIINVYLEHITRKSD